jgi:hypothetical protein
MKNILTIVFVFCSFSAISQVDTVNQLTSYVYEIKRVNREKVKDWSQLWFYKNGEFRYDTEVMRQTGMWSYSGKLRLNIEDERSNNILKQNISEEYYLEK